MLGQVNKAIGKFERTLQEQPNYAGVHVYLGRLYFEKGRYDSAWQHVRQAEVLGEPVAELINVLRRVSTEP
jgi:cytochrome c-type biogenesis protein CcmH/NrfG